MEPWAFQSMFEMTPIIGYVVARDWSVVAVTDRLLREIGQPRDAVVGRNVFEVFPDNPEDPDADGSAVMRASLERAFASGEAEVLPRRVSGYQRAALDGICASGEVVWVGAGLDRVAATLEVAVAA